MANFRQIHVSIWKDEWFLELEPNEKLLFIYLFSNESAPLSGIYRLALKVICFECGMDKDSVISILTKFAEAGKVFYQDGIVWVVNMRKYHETGSPKIKSRIIYDLDNIPDCPLKQKYIAYFNNNIPHLYPIYTSLLKEEEEELKEEVEEQLSAPPASFFSHHDVIKLIAEASGMVAIPPKELQRTDQLFRLLEAYGYDATLRACKSSYQRWIATDRRDGFGKYRGTNFAWIDWAQDVLAGNSPPEKDPSQMTDDEFKAMLRKQADALDAH